MESIKIKDVKKNYGNGSLILITTEGTEINILNSWNLEFDSDPRFIDDEGKPILIKVSFDIQRDKKCREDKVNV